MACRESTTNIGYFFQFDYGVNPPWRHVH
jgi:hypothetical protein